MTPRPTTRRPIAAAALLLALAACDRGYAREEARVLTGGGDPAKGALAIRTYGCGSCHSIPGIRGADALVGPPLVGIAERAYIGGVLTNTPENMMSWIMNPKAVDPRTAMPNLGVSEADARHIASYLYSQRTGWWRGGD